MIRFSVQLLNLFLNILVNTNITLKKVGLRKAEIMFSNIEYVYFKINEV